MTKWKSSNVFKLSSTWKAKHCNLPYTHNKKEEKKCMHLTNETLIHATKFTYLKYPLESWG